MPEGDWYVLAEACDIWSRATGKDVPIETFRRWCRERMEPVEDLDVWHIGDRYLVSVESILSHFERKGSLALEFVAEERAKLNADK